MSQETMEWLNTNVLIGYADNRDQWAAAGGWVRANEEGLIVPWHAKEGYENAYPGPIPVDAVLSKLFSWEAESHPIYIKVPCDVTEADSLDEDGHGYRLVRLEEFQAIVRSDSHYPFEVFRESYQAHQYKEWLLDNVANILDDELGIESALLLKKGAVACVTVSIPDVLKGDSEYPILPRLMAFTSFNGQYVTTVKEAAYSPVCDNSMSGLTRSKTREFKVKHTRHSHLRINDAREALGIVYKQAEDMVAFFDALAKWELTNAQVRAVRDQVIPIPDPKVEDGKVANQRAITIAENKQAEFSQVYKRDPRANQWDGTALGVVQAFNTWDQQVKNVRGERLEHNVLNTIKDLDAEFDAIVLASLSDVTGVTVQQQDNQFDLVKVES